MRTPFGQLARHAISVVLAFIVSACGQLPDASAPSPQPLTLHSSLSSRTNIVPNLNTAKNVILFGGDGMGGYTTRGNPILGLVVGNDVTGRPDYGPYLADDGLPYSVLAYANGPGGVTELPRTVGWDEG